MLPSAVTSEQAMGDKLDARFAWTVANLAADSPPDGKVSPAGITANSASKTQGGQLPISRRRGGGVVVSMNGARILPPSSSLPSGSRPLPPPGKPVGLTLEPIVTPMISQANRAPTPGKTTRRSSSSAALSLRGVLARGTEDAAGQAMRRRVYFCPTPQNTTHNVTPYGKKYGKHPSFFDFNRKGEMQLTDAGIAAEMEEQEHGGDLQDLP